MPRMPGRTNVRGSQLDLVVRLVAALASPHAIAADVQVGRYATVAPAPTEEQVRLLAGRVSIQFPASVSNVEQAVAYLLRPSGYRLANSAHADPARAGLFDLPLPRVHRSLGPMSLQSALETLAGPAFRLVEDPVHRLVTFERCGLIEPWVLVPPTTKAR